MLGGFNPWLCTLGRTGLVVECLETQHPEGREGTRGTRSPSAKYWVLYYLGYMKLSYKNKTRLSEVYFLVVVLVYLLWDSLPVAILIRLFRPDWSQNYRDPLTSASPAPGWKVCITMPCLKFILAVLCRMRFHSKKTNAHKKPCRIWRHGLVRPGN